jgi:Domain of unknown function (DUF397)
MEPRWKKSSFSEGVDNCVELAHAEAVFCIRDSKNTGPVLTLTTGQGLALLTAIKQTQLR